jgi:hypothetical protein
MVTNVINWLASAIVEVNAIARIYKYKMLHEGHHFISMAMEVHGALRHDMDCFIRECACIFHDRWLWGHLFLSFCIQIFKQRVSIAFQHTLTFAIEKKIALVRDVCSRSPIIIKSHDLYVGDIRGVVSEIASYHERD